MPDRPTTASSVAAIGELEALPPVRDALRAAVLSLPGRNPRQTKAFINLWRFYMVLDHRMGLFSPSLLAIERHSIEMARLVELMVRWPYLLDPLGERFSRGGDRPATNLDRLLDALRSGRRAVGYGRVTPRAWTPATATSRACGSCCAMPYRTARCSAPSPTGTSDRRRLCGEPPKRPFMARICSFPR